MNSRDEFGKTVEDIESELKETRDSVQDLTQSLNLSNIAAGDPIDFRKACDTLIKELGQSKSVFYGARDSLIAFRKACAARTVDYLKKQSGDIKKICAEKYRDNGPCKKAHKIFFASLVAVLGYDEKYFVTGVKYLNKISNYAQIN